MNHPYGNFDVGLWDLLPGDTEDECLSRTSHDVSTQYGAPTRTQPAQNMHPLQSHEHQTFFTRVPERQWQSPAVDIALAAQHLYPNALVFDQANYFGMVSDGPGITSNWSRSSHSINPDVPVSGTCSDPRDTGPSSLQLQWPPSASDIFKPLLRRSDPPETDFVVGVSQPQPQNPRFEGDLYTAQWTRGDGPDRFGWCGYCSSWWRLKDSAYWYHAHYTHGVSCTTGRQFPLPIGFRRSPGASDWEAYCGACSSWVPVGNGQRLCTAYWRHAYKCQTRHRKCPERMDSGTQSRSPRKSPVRPSLLPKGLS
ncbi:hypothetical protein EJ03DRAFT_141323 [Teratosphaeria nubilosa]|uniref:Transcription regulator Rua1 C-terminal domain-containing protein n=1 Tax=Teratosphaeria nubilosa TaxID=161662 RepID=A0A6G1L541_9PEZI|nr:hypothetical protein EJ03DRAFT_141323 [Teratosphaeria nubilosa]